MRSRALFVAFLFISFLHASLGAAEERKPRESTSNDNFIVTAPTQRIAELVMNRAQVLRDEIARELLGATLPLGVGRTIIHVTVTDEVDKAWTWPTSGPKDPSNMMWIHTREEDVVGSLLAHEMTHAVLAARYPGRFPAWVNEGIASMRDDDERKAIRKRILKWYADSGNWPDVTSVVESPRISPSNQQSYAIASSLVDFLLSRGNQRQLVEFAAAGNGGNWATAFDRYYGLDSAAAIQREWQAWVARHTADGIAMRR